MSKNVRTGAASGPSDCSAYFFTFPFWIYCVRPDGWSDVTVTFGEFALRIYPPFRSGESTFHGMPRLSEDSMPLVGGDSPDWSAAEMLVPHNTRIPTLNDSRKGWEDSCWVTKKGEAPGPWTADAMAEALPAGNFPMDSLRVDCLTPQEGARWVVERFVEGLLLVLQTRTLQWWILRDNSKLLGYLRAVYPLETDTGFLRGPAGGASRISAVTFGFESPLTEPIWREAVDDTSRWKTPPLSDRIWLETPWLAKSGGLLMVPLYLSISIEEALTRALFEFWSSKGGDAKFKRSRFLSGDSLPKHLDSDCKRVFSRSLREEVPVAYELIQEMWRFRGLIAHGQAPRINIAGKSVELEFGTVGKYFGATGTCLKWIESLSRSNKLRSGEA